MKLQDTSRVHDAVYWAIETDPNGQSVRDDYGQPIYRAPVEVKVFWADIEQMVTAGNEQKKSRAFLVVGFRANLGDMFFRGLIADLPPGLAELPKRINDAAQVIKRDRYENRKQQVAHFAYL